MTELLRHGSQSQGWPSVEKAGATLAMGACTRPEDRHHATILRLGAPWAA
jgi:hypothetical protein